MRTYIIAVCLALVACLSGACTALQSDLGNTNAAVGETAADQERGNGDAVYSANTVVSGETESSRSSQGEKISYNRSSIPAEDDSRRMFATRKVIRNAEVYIESQNPYESQQKISSIVEKFDGYIVDSSRQTSTTLGAGRESVDISLRVPSDEFHNTLNEIRGTGDRLVSESVSGRDVTEEFVDLKARLVAQRLLEEQINVIMKRSRTVAEALSVQNELGNVRTEIERIEGRLAFLENQSSLSTIGVKISTAAEISDSTGGFFYELRDALGDGSEDALSFVLGFVRFALALLPFLLLVVLPITLVVRYVWRINRLQGGQVESAAGPFKGDDPGDS